jgi:hypothetical protein
MKKEKQGKKKLIKGGVSSLGSSSQGRAETNKETRLSSLNMYY